MLDVLLPHFDINTQMQMCQRHIAAIVNSSNLVPVILNVGSSKRPGHTKLRNANRHNMLLSLVALLGLCNKLTHSSGLANTARLDLFSTRRWLNDLLGNWCSRSFGNGNVERLSKY